MKFGGSSVADADRLRQVAQRILQRANEGPVVVVVSAMGKTTNELVAQAQALCGAPPARELDMLLTTGERHAMAMLAITIAGFGGTAVSLTGSQSGIVTNRDHGNAEVLEVRPFRILDELDRGKIVIVGGFQGVSYKREITTLGRGGSDTTAVALAAALGGDCEIYSDVDGVYSADPREIPQARRLEAITYEEMAALSQAGARVLHAKAVELARAKGIAIYARASDGRTGQTVIRQNPARAPGFRAVASRDVRLVAWRGELARAEVPRLAAQLCAHGMMRIHTRHDGIHGVHTGDETTALAQRFTSPPFDAEAPSMEPMAEVTCVGSGLQRRSDLAQAAVNALDEAGLPIYGVDVAPHAIAFFVRTSDRQAALHALHPLVDER